MDGAAALDPAIPRRRACTAADVSRAIAAGLMFRPLEETVRGTLDEAETDGRGRNGARAGSGAPRGVEGSVASQRVEGFDFVHRETVRFRDVDSMGHVNNAVFLTYIEEARIAYLLRVRRRGRRT